MDNLFTNIERYKRTMNAPLAARMRPQTLEEYVGQTEAVGPGSWLRTAIEHDTLSSVILYGPAGTGKTTLARIIANSTHAEFVEVSAVTGTVKDLRREIEAAESRLLSLGRRTILFVDEIHRFNRSQQDALLHAVEDRTVVLVGATTENPYFEVNSALLSRSRVVELEPLDDDSIRTIVRRAVTSEYGLKGAFTLDDDALEEIVTLAGGDGRASLTSLELASQMAAPAGTATPEEPVRITRAHVLEANPRHGLSYDKSGDMHYDIISAFIKSIRGSDPDGAIYWLARMVEGGEDPAFIARRLVISASEDIGLANPNALLLANACFDTLMKVGWPEGRIPLAEATIYLATSPKSNSAYMAINNALELVRETGNLPVPLHLRNAPTKLMKQLGYGEKYKYAHDYPGNFVKQQFLPDELKDRRIWEPQLNPAEQKHKERMQQLWGEEKKW